MATLALNSASGIGRGRICVLKVDGKVVVSEKMDRTAPLVLQWDETFEVGTNSGTPVDNKMPLKFAGKLNKLTPRIDRPKLTAEEVKKRQTAGRNKITE